MPATGIFLGWAAGCGRPTPDAPPAGYGDSPDGLAEMDAHAGELLDMVDVLGAHDAVFVSTSDNGPEAS